MKKLKECPLCGNRAEFKEIPFTKGKMKTPIRLIGCSYENCALWIGALTQMTTFAWNKLSGAEYP